MTTITQSIPSLGSPPLTTDPANFDTRADTLYGTSLPAVITATNTWSGQANTVAGEVNTNATNSATSASAASTSAGNASTSASAASSSASAASSSASAASSSASTATAQAVIATTQAGIATTQATNSSNSAAAAAASAATAASISASGLDVVVNGSVVEVDNSGGLTSGSKTGTAPQDIVRHQFLSGMAYQDPNAVTIGGGSATLTSLTATTVTGTSMVYNGAELNSRLNPLAQAVSVQMTASTTVNGIQQLDNDNLDMGTNNFTIHWEGSLPDYTPAASIVLARKNTDGATAGWLWGVLAAGTMFITLRDGLGGAGTTYTSTAATAATDGSTQKLSVVVVRETASVAGSITYYVNGVQLGSALAITAGTAFTLNNALPLYVNGSATTRTEGSLQASRLYNRALTSAEVLDLSINGVALADRGASQTALITGDSSNFEGGTVGSWVANSVAPTSLAVNIISPLAGGDDLLCSSTTNTNSGFNLNIGTTRAAVRYRIQFIYKAESGSNWSVSLRETTSGTSAIPSTTTLSGSTTLTSDGTLREFFWEFQPAATTSNTRLLFKNTAGAIQSIQADNFDYKVIGLTSELIASNAQSDTGQILDSSGNKNHALLPASGATVVGRPVSQTREVRWTNTWAGTNELQYIGGVNQAILPSNAYIESIVGTVSGATPHDIIIGDGSDTDRYVTITTGLAAGTTSFTLANRTTDGTNLKLTVDPDTNATMSIAWVIRYSTLEA